MVAQLAALHTCKPEILNEHPPKMPPGYDGQLEYARLTGQNPMSPKAWERVLAEMDEMPGTMDPSYPEDNPKRKET